MPSDHPAMNGSSRHDGRPEPRPDGGRSAWRFPAFFRWIAIAWALAAQVTPSRAVELPSRVANPTVGVRPKSLASPFPSGISPQVRLRLEAPDLSVVQAEDATARARHPKGRARVGIRRVLPEPVRVQGGKSPWTLLPDGSRAWIARVESVGALAMRLRLEGVDLAGGAELRVCAADHPGESHGPFDAETQGDRPGLWTPSIEGPVVLLECRVPAGAPMPSFRISEVTHRYVPMGHEAQARGGKPSATAAACHVDVSCEPAWATTAQSVAGIGAVGVVGEIFCSGCLLNDLDPAPKTDYLLTADHCLFNQSEADSAEFYWKYQTPSCNGSAPGPSTVPRTVGGADILSALSEAEGNDHCFVRLRGPVPAGVTYAGWNSDPPAPEEVLTGIHHPQGDFKRISFGVGQRENANYRIVRWTRGVTEVGSSGSPLFNARQQVIGQLFGGESDCSVSDPSHQLDDYGRFNVTFPKVRRWLLNEPATVPPNDPFSAATLLTGASGSLGGTTVNASREAGEPDHAQGGGRNSIWHLWTAPVSGVVTFETVGSDFDTTLGVYQGVAVAQLSRVAANDDLEAGNPASRVGFVATAGMPYRIAVDGRDGAIGTVVLTWRPGGSATPPPNDLFTNSAPTVGFGGVYRGNNRGFTRESLEPSHAGGQGARSAWWRWTAPISAPVVINTLDSAFDTLLAVYTGDSVSRLTLVAENDDIVEPMDSIQSEVRFDAVAGVTYHTAIDGFGNGSQQEEGPIRLDISQKGGTPSGNDRFAAAAHLVGASGSVTANNRNFTREAGEPNHAGVAANRSAWWDWTAPADGTTRFETTGSAFDTLLAVYTGNTVASLQRVVDNDDILSGDVWQSRLEFQAVRGTVYRIAVDGFADAGPPVIQEEGNIRLAWHQTPTQGPAQPFAIQPGWSAQGRFEVRLTGQVGVRYALERTRSLAPDLPVWNRLATAVGDGSLLVMADAEAPGAEAPSGGYFRVVTLP